MSDRVLQERCDPAGPQLAVPDTDHYPAHPLDVPLTELLLSKAAGRVFRHSVHLDDDTMASHDEIDSGDELPTLIRDLNLWDQLKAVQTSLESDLRLEGRFVSSVGSLQDGAGRRDASALPPGVEIRIAVRESTRPGGGIC